jgi:glycine betaine/proline transport system permease protein/glycine betaine/proline transport system substrate-binding protein
LKKKIILNLLCVIIVTLLSACSTNVSGDSEPIKAVFADAGWDSIRFHNAVASYIGNAAYNINGDDIPGTTPITYNGMISGDVDVYMEVWVDNLPTYYQDLDAGKFKELGINFDDNKQGFYVPRYVIEGDAERGIKPMAPDLKTVEDLKKYSDVFVDPDDKTKGRIYGAISGWEVDTVMRNKYKFYGLDESYNYFDPGSEAASVAVIASSYDKGEPIVSYHWDPTWLTGKLDLVILEDAPYDEQLYPLGQTECPSMNITICVSNDFYEKAPEYCEFLSKYRTSSALTADALSYIQDTDASMTEAAEWFLKEHDELITNWLPEDKAELVRSKLNN